MLRKMTHPVLALAFATGVAMTSVDQAQPGDGAALPPASLPVSSVWASSGATVGARHGYYYDAYGAPGVCYHGPRTCTWEHRYCFENGYGDYAPGGVSAGVR